MANGYINIPEVGAASWREPVADVGSLPSLGNTLGDARVVEATNIIYIWNGSAWVSTGGGGGSGTVTSVALTAPAIFSVSGSPVSTSGTLALSYSGTALPIANGGTSGTTKSGAFDALSPMSASGDLIYGGTSGTGTRLAKGSDGNVLTLASGIPSWSAPSTGTVTNIVTGTGLTGGPITTTGTISVVADAGLPSQTSNSGKFLTTNGTVSSWGTASGFTVTGCRIEILSNATSSGGTQVPFSSSDVASGWDASFVSGSSGEFVAPATGFYQIGMNWTSNSFSTPITSNLSYSINSVSPAFGVQTSQVNGPREEQSFTTAVRLTASDIIRFFIVDSTAGGAYRTHCWILKLF